MGPKISCKLHKNEAEQRNNNDGQLKHDAQNQKTLTQ